MSSAKGKLLTFKAKELGGVFSNLMALNMQGLGNRNRMKFCKEVEKKSQEVAQENTEILEDFGVTFSDGVPELDENGNMDFESEEDYESFLEMQQELLESDVSWDVNQNRLMFTKILEGINNSSTELSDQGAIMIDLIATRLEEALEV